MNMQLIARIKRWMPRIEDNSDCLVAVVVLVCFALAMWLTRNGVNY